MIEIKKGLDILKINCPDSMQMNKKFKIFLLISSYSFFLFILIIAFNAVIPENNLVVIDANKPIIKKIENKFENDKDSFLTHLERLSRNWPEFAKNLQNF